MTWAIEGYETVAELGHGETGVVVRARDTAGGGEVAIRYLARKLCHTSGFLDRYRADVAALSVIDHPNVGAVHGLVERPEAAAVITELVAGIPLRELLLRAGRLEPTAALYVVYSVLHGLTLVHARAIVHRALRPENVFLDEGGTVKVVDVGLARPSGDRLPANPFYASPELWFGDPANPTADVFAATAILYECLSGQPPRGASGAYVGRSGQSPDAAIAALGPDLAGGQIGMFLAHGLATDPAARLDDARAAAETLKAVAAATVGPDWYDDGRTVLRRCMSRAPVWTGDAPPPWLANAEPDEWMSADPWPEWAPEPVRVKRTRAAATVRSSVDTAPPPVPAPAEPVPRSMEWEPDPRPLVLGEGRPVGPRSHRARSGRGRLLVTLGLVVVLAAGAMLAVPTAFRMDPAASGPGADPRSTIATDPTAAVSGTAGAGADTVAPGVPTGLRVTGRSVSGVSLDWVPATDNVGVTGYVVLRDGVRVGTAPAPGVLDHGPTGDTDYVYAVAAYDAAGNTSAPGATVTATTLKDPDLLRPTAPTGLAVTNATEDRIALMWSAARDDIGVAGYQIFRDGTLLTTVPRPGFTDTGLTPGPAYQYQVRAFDMSNNVSAFSGAVTGTTKAPPA